MFNRIVEQVWRFRVVVSLLPFSMPFLYLWMLVSDKFGWYIIPIEWPIMEFEIYLYFFYWLARPLSLPFYPILVFFGLWEQKSFVLPTAPTFGGYFLVATVYSLVVFYLILKLKKYIVGRSEKLDSHK